MIIIRNDVTHHHCRMMCLDPFVYPLLETVSDCLLGWDGYDTCYTERYMGTPKSNEKGHGINSSNIEARVEDVETYILVFVFDPFSIVPCSASKALSETDRLQEQFRDGTCPILRNKTQHDMSTVCSEGR